MSDNLAVWCYNFCVARKGGLLKRRPMKNKNTKCAICHAVINSGDRVSLNLKTKAITHEKCYRGMIDLCARLSIMKMEREAGVKNEK